MKLKDFFDHKSFQTLFHVKNKEHLLRVFLKEKYTHLIINWAQKHTLLKKLQINIGL